MMLSEDGMTRLGGSPTGGGPEHLRVSRHLLWYVCRESSSQRGWSTNVARLGKALGSAINPEPGISPSSSCIQVPPTVHNSAINHWLVSPLSTRCHSAADMRVLDSSPDTMLRAFRQIIYQPFICCCLCWSPFFGLLELSGERNLSWGNALIRLACRHVWGGGIFLINDWCGMI